MKKYDLRKQRLAGFSLRPYAGPGKKSSCFFQHKFFYVWATLMCVGFVFFGFMYVRNKMKIQDSHYLSSYLRTVKTANQNMHDGNKEMAGFEFSWLNISWNKYRRIERMLGTMIDNLPSSVEIQQVSVTKYGAKAVFISSQQNAIENYLKLLQSNYLFAHMHIDAYSFQHSIYTLGVSVSR